MKTYLFTLLLMVFCFTACDDGEDKTIDPTVMPEATTSGKGTLGFLYNGWIYTAGRYYEMVPFSPEHLEPIHCYYDKGKDLLHIDARVAADKVLSFNIPAPKDQQTVAYTGATFAGLELPDGEVTITRFDKVEKIFSGTFEGGRISHGRFDVYLNISPIPSE